MIAKSRLESTPLRPSTERARASILVVDDDPAVLKMTRRRLERQGHRVVACTSGQEALEKLTRETFDAMVSDIRMPGMTGMDLLRAVREHDLDLPVVLVTGDPALDSATAAVAYGAFQYLTKPVASGELESSVDRAATLGQLARLKREFMDEATSGVFRVGDRAGAEATIGKALEGLWVAFQPIVSCRDQTIVAYEGLVRCADEAALSQAAIARVAERAGRLADLGRQARAKTAQAMSRAGQQWLAFINLQPSDLLDDELYSLEAPLSKVASRVVLELTERAALEDVPSVRERVRDLRRLGYRIGLGDLGTGHSGLNTFVSLEPEFVKLDASLVHDVHRDPARRKIVGSLAGLCHEMSAQIIAEGVESFHERDALAALSCDHAQGPLYARLGVDYESATAPGQSA
jgi:EAL domain-containing protein (putative c-di-GMP-specific phosphodiesterase class I)